MIYIFSFCFSSLSFCSDDFLPEQLPFSFCDKPQSHSARCIVSGPTQDHFLPNAVVSDSNTQNQSQVLGFVSGTARCGVMLFPGAAGREFNSRCFWFSLCVISNPTMSHAH